MRVGYVEAVWEIAGYSANAACRIAKWRRKYLNLVPSVKGFVHECRYRVSSPPVLNAVARGERALDTVEKERPLLVASHF